GTPGGFLNFFNGNGSTTQIVASNFGILTANTWQHIVVTRVAATKQVRFYVNGVAKGVGTYTVNPTTTTNPVAIGRSSAAATRYVQGKLDEVAIYSQALSPAQVATHYALRNADGSNAPVALPLAASDPD